MELGWFKWVTLVKDLAVAFVSATIGILGIKAWKKQFKGKENYELARSVLKLARQVEAGIKTVRNPARWHDDYQEGRDRVQLEKSNYEEKISSWIVPSLFELEAVCFTVEDVLVHGGRSF